MYFHHEVTQITLIKKIVLNNNILKRFQLLLSLIFINAVVFSKKVFTCTMLSNSSPYWLILGAGLALIGGTDMDTP